MRQWVLTVPHRLRSRIGYDHALCKHFLRVVGRELQTHYRNKTGQRKGHIGTVTFIQRFKSGLAQPDMRRHKRGQWAHLMRRAFG